MEKTGVVIGRDSWLLLRDEPLYSARFIDRDGTDELALVVRVEELEWFVESGLPLAVSLCTWQSSRGVWLAAIAYQLSPSFGEARAGVFFLNPRRTEDATLLDKLPRQERLGRDLSERRLRDPLHYHLAPGRRGARRVAGADRAHHPGGAGHHPERRARSRL